MNPLYITIDDVKHILSKNLGESIVWAINAPDVIYNELKQKPYWQWIKSDQDIAEYRKIFNQSVIAGGVVK